MFTAILSTTILPVDGNYSVKTVAGADREEVLNNLAGVAHYIGHPDTKAIAEGLGATPAPTKLFKGLAVGEQAVCLPIKQGLSSRATEGFTIHQAIEEINTLDVRVITRLADASLAENAINHLRSELKRFGGFAYADAGDGGYLVEAAAAALNIADGKPVTDSVRL